MRSKGTEHALFDCELMVIILRSSIMTHSCDQNELQNLPWIDLRIVIRVSRPQANETSRFGS